MTLFLDTPALLEQFRRGDREALSAVYEHYVAEVEAVVKRGFPLATQGGYVAGAKDVEVVRELVQETFVRAFSDQARAAYDGVRRYRPYLVQIAKNLLIDRVRALGNGSSQCVEPRRPRAVAYWWSVYHIAENGSPADDLHRLRLAAAVAEFVNDLEPEARTFVALRFDQDLSQEHVAEKMSCSRRRVRTLESRVRTGLRRYLRRRRLIGD
jgi:RNA polymerase sigma factor (sigma-70 family)